LATPTRTLKAMRETNKPFAASSFLADHGIEVGEVTRSYLNAPCCWCHGSSTSPTPLGFHRTGGYVTCFRCGSHPLVHTIARILHLSIPQAQAIRGQYTYADASQKSLEITFASSCTPPGGPLTPRYRAYLESRGLDPELIALEYGVLASGPICRWYGETRDWKGVDFSDRLVVPISDRLGRVVAFQGRTIARNEPMRWKFPPLDRVAAHYKETLYNLHRHQGDTVAVVEGIPDAWKLGRGSVASYGTSMSQTQIRLLGGFRRVVMLFDSEPAAQARARRVAREISALGARVDVCDLQLPLGPSGKALDIGDLGSAEVQAIRREIGI
jgi:hypothetical protein